MPELCSEGRADAIPKARFRGCFAGSTRQPESAEPVAGARTNGHEALWVTSLKLAGEGIAR